MLLASTFAAVRAVAESVEPSPRAALLGRSEAQLREEFGAALLPERIEAHRAGVPVPEKRASPNETAAPGKAPRPAPTAEPRDPFASQKRLVQYPKKGDVQRVEYELFRTQVYRVRWRLVERFERLLMASLVTHLTAEFGRPHYDQLIEGKFGSGRATLRRAAWRSGSRNLEIRQLNPLVGGPIFMTLSDQQAIKAIIASGGTAAPEPDSIGPWWNKPIKPSKPLSTGERNTLLAAFDGVLARADWGHQHPAR